MRGERRRIRRAIEDGLLEKEDPCRLRDASHQVIGALKDETPAQVRKAKNIALFHRQSLA